MSRHRAFRFVSVLAALTLIGASTATALTGSEREISNGFLSAASASRNPHDSVLPYQSRPEVMSAARRNDREKTGRTPVVAITAGAGLRSGHARVDHGGVSLGAASTLTSGSRAPPVAPSFSLR